MISIALTLFVLVGSETKECSVYNTAQISTFESREGNEPPIYCKFPALGIRKISKSSQGHFLIFPRLNFYEIILERRILLLLGLQNGQRLFPCGNHSFQWNCAYILHHHLNRNLVGWDDTGTVVAEGYSAMGAWTSNKRIRANFEERDAGRVSIFHHLLGKFVRLPRFMKSSVNKKDANGAQAHTDQCSDAHYFCPPRGNFLRGKVLLYSLVFASGLLSFGYALHLGRRDERSASLPYLILGVLFIYLGALGSLLLKGLAD